VFATDPDGNDIMVDESAAEELFRKAAAGGETAPQPKPEPKTTEDIMDSFMESPAAPDTSLSTEPKKVTDLQDGEIFTGAIQDRSDTY
jgi:hypothetical protein